MKIPIVLMTLTLLTIVLGVLGWAGSPEREKTTAFQIPVGFVDESVVNPDGTIDDYEAYFNIKPLIVTDYFEEIVVLEDEPEKEKPKPEFPNKEQLKLIGRLAEGAIEWKMKEGGWWECGVFYDKEEDVKRLALLYSYEIVKAVHEVSDGEGTDDRWTLNAWGLAGTMKNESQWDRCAFGLYPRKAAYKMGLLKRRKRCISHTEEEVLRALADEGMQRLYKKTGVDLGTAQVLSRFYENPKDYKRMLSLRGSTMQAAVTMRKRSRMFGTNRPWRYWRGYNCEWYDDKITRKARSLGATRKEI
jgi:hypothetical protein